MRCVLEPPICVICDEGGDLVYCEGPCRRHVHPCRADGVLSKCRTLSCGYDVIKSMNGFYCNNCVLNIHLCSICHKVRYIDKKDNHDKDLYQCASNICHAFFHLSCFKKTLKPKAQAKWHERVKRNPSSFLCSRHACCECAEEGENFTHLVQCRRCPKAWHISCLPHVSYYPTTDRGYTWKYGYCSKHPIVEKFGTPSRNHVDFYPRPDSFDDE